MDTQVLLRTLALVATGFLAVAVLVRFSRGRTLAKMNAFELFVTAALAGFLVLGLVNPGIPLGFVLGASAGLVVLQAVLSAVVRRLHGGEHLWRSEPALVFRRGHFLRGSMRRLRVSEDEVVRAIKARGWKRFQDVDAVVLEADGTFSVFGMAGKQPENMAPPIGA